MSKENNLEFLHLVHVIKEPNTFKYSDNVRDHLKTVRNYFEQTKCPDDLKIQLFLKYLSLGVLEDLKLQLDYNDDADLYWYEDKMLELYDDKRSLVTILVELVDIKQKQFETVIDFASRIKEKVENKKIPINMQDNIKLQLFINGLKRKSYTKALQILNPKSLTEAVNILRLDCNLIERCNNEENGDGESTDYIKIIKTLSEKINPSFSDQNDYSKTHLFNKPESLDSHSTSEDYKTLYSNVIDKLKNPNCKGIIIVPKSNEDFKIIDLPQNEIIIGIPLENQSYEITACKTNCGYIITDKVANKPAVYKLPSSETVVINSDGKIHFIKNLTLIGPSKSDHKMDIELLPEILLDRNNKSLTCKEVISILGAYNLKEPSLKTNESDLFEEPLLIGPRTTNENSEMANINEFVNSLKIEEQKGNLINQNPQTPVASEFDIPIAQTGSRSGDFVIATNSQFSTDNYGLETFHVSPTVQMNNLTTQNSVVDCLTKESESKMVNENPIQTNSSCPNYSFPSDGFNSREQDIPIVENVHLSAIIQSNNSEQVLNANLNNLQMEITGGKAVGRFKITPAPHN